MKIGILTSWFVPNYGAFMQAYALQKVISGLRPDDDVLQIAYINKVHYDVYYSLFYAPHRFWLINPRFYKDLCRRLLNWSKREQLKVFLDYFARIPHTKTLNDKSICEEKFDIVVLGSDIIWDYSQQSFGKDEFVFGNHMQVGKVVAYAPSFGTVKADRVPPAYVVDGLQKMGAIAVRDENSARLVKQYTGKDALVVLDPTLLMDANDEKFVKPDIEDYIVVYGSSFTTELINGARAYADSHNLKLVCLDSLDDTFDWCDVNISQERLSPFAWCGYFKHAKAIFTCTYHGLLFGLIFQKRLIFSPTQFILDKASSLIDYLDLRQVLVEMTDFADKADWDWDYSRINAKFAVMREKSMEYLKESLKVNG
ncbi:polysaccharide pyruvyl transferase family protein [Selenomonas caprae]|uniref:Polysaccharide pyruvyl transferase family protein n=1 Tax=Selenomonas caprae TaxID=2606905 RepID=A0A5D6WIR6_9FIRM|nr:polysaccharide pyruvyl transferase family protein [Selenomonas caprae]TYZ27780.1 polysaccharide pyruvyl transferase family protein [Selenomonas caprae]